MNSLLGCWQTVREMERDEREEMKDRKRGVCKVRDRKIRQESRSEGTIIFLTHGQFTFLVLFGRLQDQRHT